MPHEGDVCVEGAGVPRHPLQAVRDAVGLVYELPKGRSTALVRHRPPTEGNSTMVTGRTPTGRRHDDQTTT